MAQKSTQHCRNKSAIESSFGESLKNIAQKSGLGKNTPIRTMNGTSAPPKEPEQDLTVVKQIKHLGLQKQSSKILVEGLVVVENRLEARKKERNLRKDPKVLQGANKLLDLQKQSSLEMSTKPLDVESKVEVREQERVPRKKQKGLTVLQGAGSLSSSDLALQNQPKLAGLVSQEKKFTSISGEANQAILPSPRVRKRPDKNFDQKTNTDSNLGVAASHERIGKDLPKEGGPPGMQMVVTVADYQNGEIASKKSKELIGQKICGSLIKLKSHAAQCCETTALIVT